MTDEEKNNVEDAKKNLYDALQKDEDRFENKITYISAGAIALSLTFVATLKEQPVCGMWALYCGLSLNFVAILMNMIMYLVGKKWQRKLIDKFDNNLKQEIFPDPQPNDQIVKNGKRVDKYNAWNLGLMAVGLLFLALFVCNHLK